MTRQRLSNQSRHCPSNARNTIALDTHEIEVCLTSPSSLGFFAHFPQRGGFAQARWRGCVLWSLFTNLNKWLDCLDWLDKHPAYKNLMLCKK